MIHPFGKGGVVWPLLVFAVLVMLRPIGLGDADDERYVRAAFVWIDEGAHLGESHWALRHPLVLPIAGSFAVFGPGPVMAALPNIAAAVLLISMSFFFGRPLLGHRSAFLLAILVASSSALSLDHVEITIGGIEVFWSALALWLFTSAILADTPHRPRLLLAGLAAGVAWLCRETAAYLPAVFLFAALLISPARRTPSEWLLPLLGFAIIAAAELTLYATTAGDPFYRYWIDMGHGSSGESGVFAEISRGDYLDIIADPLSRLFLHPVRGPMSLVAVGAAFWLISLRNSLTYETKVVTVVFGVAGLSSFVFSSLVLSLESPIYYLMLAYAASLVVSVVLGCGVQRISDRTLFATAAFFVIVGAILSSLRSGTDVQSIRAATMLAEKSKADLTTASWWTAQQLETSLRLRGMPSRAAHARVRWSETPKPGDRVIIIRLPNYTFTPEPRWELIEEIPVRPTGLRLILVHALPRTMLPTTLKRVLYRPGGAAIYLLPELIPAD